jgi:hypothetical protein
MPTTQVDLDITFIEGIAAGRDVTTALTFNQPENIGERYMPVVFETGSLKEADTSEPVEVIIGTTVSGYLDRSAEFTTKDADTSVIESLVQFTRVDITSFSENIDVVYQVQTTMVSGYLSNRLEFIGGDLYNSFDQRVVEFRPAAGADSAEDTIVGYTNFTGLFSGDNPIPFYSTGRETSVALVFGQEWTAGLEARVDLTFAGWVMHEVSTDIYSVIQQLSDFGIEVTVASGVFQAVGCDVQTSFDNLKNYAFDLMCASGTLLNLDTVLTVVSGSVDHFGYEAYACDEIRSTVDFDVDLLSLYIHNFSLNVDEYMYADQVLSVDVIDDVHNVVTSGTYFMVDGVQVPVTYSGIDDGYRVFFDAADDYASLEGPTTITVRAENDNGDAYTRDYYVTFGYIVEYINKKIDFGLNKKIGVRMTAEDNASCPVFSTDGYWFETLQADSNDLTASIFAVPEDSADLTASLIPHTTAYTYGKVFRVVLTCKDFAGNEMEPFIFEYKIEDQPVET